MCLKVHKVVTFMVFIALFLLEYIVLFPTNLVSILPTICNFPNHKFRYSFLDYKKPLH